MIHYHGTPVGGKLEDSVRFLRGRHAFVSFAHRDDMPVVADVCSSFALDNGAYSMWRRGIKVDWDKYAEWVMLWCRHPGFDFAIIPDVIDGTEQDNLELIKEYSVAFPGAVPVFHLHESNDHAEWLASNFGRVALGSSGVYAQPGTKSWWGRMREVMKVLCGSDGRPKAKLHGLRMLNPELYAIPFSSADSTNVVRNANIVRRFGQYPPPALYQRMDTIAHIIEAENSAPVWIPSRQLDLLPQYCPKHEQVSILDNEEMSCIG